MLLASCRFGSVAAIFKAAAADVQASAGIGPTKARRLHETFHLPFRRSLSATAAAPAPSAPQDPPAAAKDKDNVDDAHDSFDDSDIDLL
jgi:DNA excision repair protein ERCC-1